MEKPEFIAGSEKGFISYVSGLGDAKKIALISHTDVDGIASAKIADRVIKPDIRIFADYIELNISLAEKLKKEKVSHIILTDLMIKDKKFLDALAGFSSVLLIDHHTFERDFNSEKIVFLNAQGFCAAYLCYYLFSQISDVEELDWLVVCASFADWLYKNNDNWIQEVYKKYGEVFSGNIKESRFWKLQWIMGSSLVYFYENRERVYNNIGPEYGELKDLEKYALIIDEEAEKCTERFEIEKINIKDGYYWNFESKYAVKSLVINSVSAKYPDKTILIIKKEQGVLNISARRQDKKASMHELLRKLVYGPQGAEAGGHFAAAGGHALAKDAAEIEKRIANL